MKRSEASINTQYSSIKDLIAEAQKMSRDNAEVIASCSRVKVDSEGHVILPSEDKAEKCYSEYQQSKFTGEKVSTLPYTIGQIITVKYRFEENPDLFKIRPAIVIDTAETCGQIKVLGVKVTTNNGRNDKCFPYDTPIIHWTEAGLREEKSVARIVDTQFIDKNDINKVIGCLHEEDLGAVLMNYIEFLKDELTRVKYSRVEENV